MIYKLLKDFNYTTSDKKIMELKKGTTIDRKEGDEYIIKQGRQKEFTIECALVENNPDYFEKIDLKQRIIALLKKTKSKTMPKIASDVSKFLEEDYFKGKEIVVPDYKDRFDKDTSSCSSNLATELEHCFALMAQPGTLCIGMGGKVQWIATNNETKWRGKWICSTCGHSQTFSFNPRHMLCIDCKSSTCRNYGYIRISRRL